MANRKLKTNVTVHPQDENGAVNGVGVTFGPSDTLPDWARKQITNPDVWEGEDGDSGGDAEQSDLAAAGRYQEMTHDGLQEELRRRNDAGSNLKVTGRQADLISRLREDDRSR